MKLIIYPLLSLLLISCSSTQNFRYFSQKKQKIMIVSAELTGLLHSGGLGLATRDTANSLAENGNDVSVIIPFYTTLKNKVKTSLTGESVNIDLDKQESEWNVQVRYDVNRLEGDEFKANVFLFEHRPGDGFDNFFENTPNPGEKPKYTNGEEGKSFGSFDKAIVRWILEMPESERPEILMINDWHAGAIAPLMADLKESFPNQNFPKVVGAIHNLGYMGLFSMKMFGWIGFRPEHMYGKFGLDGVEFFKKISFLKGLIEYSDVIYTVSEQYAKEITTKRFGSGLDEILKRKLKERKLFGILNGIDNTQWDPEWPVKKFKDVLRYTFSASDLSGKAQGKKALQESFNLPIRENTPVIVMTSRLAQQKGFDYLASLDDQVGALEKILTSNQDMQIIITGDGDEAYINSLKNLETRFPDKFRYIGFSEEMEKKLTAYGDIFLSGPWYEPSGLNQFFTMRYGTVPVVSHVGGLAQSIVNGHNGMTFPIEFVDEDSSDINSSKTSDNIFKRVSDMLDIYHNKQDEFLKLRVNAMNEDHSWTNRMKKLKALFSYALIDGPSKLAKRNIKINSLDPEELYKLSIEDSKNLPCSSNMSIILGN